MGTSWNAGPSPPGQEKGLQAYGGQDDYGKNGKAGQAPGAGKFPCQFHPGGQIRPDNGLFAGSRLFLLASHRWFVFFNIFWVKA